MSSAWLSCPACLLVDSGRYCFLVCVAHLNPDFWTCPKASCASFSTCGFRTFSTHISLTSSMWLTLLFWCYSVTHEYSSYLQTLYFYKYTLDHCNEQASTFPETLDSPANFNMTLVEDTQIACSQCSRYNIAVLVSEASTSTYNLGLIVQNFLQRLKWISINQ